MTVAFISSDPVNCPIKEYKLVKVNKYEFDLIKYPYEDEISSVISLDKTTGIFELNNCIEERKWNVWISASGDDGMTSGISDTFNIKIHLYDPPPVLIDAPKF